jgi:hypothetical protein
MRTSIATVSISGDLGEKLEAIAAAGFDGVEIFENDLLTFGASPADVGRSSGSTLPCFSRFATSKACRSRCAHEHSSAPSASSSSCRNSAPT